MTPAVTAARRAGIEFEVVEYDAGDAAEPWGVGAARALGIAPERVFKTLVVDLSGKSLAVAMIPVDARLDLKAVANTLGAKRATMAEPAAAERATGYVSGGISPLGQRRRLPFALEENALGFERIHVSGGQRGLEIGLAPGDLVALTGAVVARIAR
ncbi:MAG: Cys-tRNA(Pro) deacylase [Chromatiales bacterium]|nr:Cys-tRNA(Pro) deacylase [Chromatiales bacterium]